MGDFHRSPSKVWWAMENPLHVGLGNWPRAASASPGSQDSGFSDTETSPTLPQTLEEASHRLNATPGHLSNSRLPRDILKDLSFEENTPKRNFTSSNFKEKYSPKKTLALNLSSDKPTYYITDLTCLGTTPQSCYIPRIQAQQLRSPVLQARTEPAARKYRPNSERKYTPRVNRNLFHCPTPTAHLTSPVDDRELSEDNQYAGRVEDVNCRRASTIQYARSADITGSSNEVSFDYNGSWLETSKEFEELELSDQQGVYDDYGEDYEEEDSTASSYSRRSIPENVRTLPLLASKKFDGVQNLSAPGILPHGQEFRSVEDLEDLDENEGITSFTSRGSSATPSSSDCESELELLFADRLESPKHTSTPKISVRKTPLMKQRIENRRARNLLLKYDRIERTRLPSTSSASVQQWLKETRNNHESEFTITLQNKPIAEELNQKVAQMAANITAPIRKLQSHTQLVEDEIQKITSEVNNSAPLRQSLSGLIVEFMSKFLNNPDADMLKLCEELKNSSSPTHIVNQLTSLVSKWQSLKYKSLEFEVKLLVDTLEDPKSEFHLRATLTGLTSITLRHNHLADVVVNSGGIGALLILTEQCQGSTIRALTLRALSSICSTTNAVRLFEQGSGIQIISDILSDKLQRPEPERSEATSLLALITSPWIEDNQSVRGLADYSKTLVASLTSFLRSTKCCLNLILCAAALANISGMEATSIKYFLHYRTVGNLLEAVRRRGPRAAVELLEQVATLLANMAAVEEAREQLTEVRAPAALLCFLQPGSNGTEAEKSLQQKSAIALSRLCGDVGASKQVVEMDGISRLVTLCRERAQRYDSDAVLVAVLATLRKIAENCGCEVLNSQDAQELVEPRLLDSFIAYSAQNESYV